MNERVLAKKKTSATPPQATQASSPLLHQRPFTDELSESVGSNSNISKELGGIQPKTIRRSLNWQNITVEAPSRSDGRSLPGGIQRQQEEPPAVIGDRVSADSAQKSALELSNSTISTSEPAQKPLIARSPFDRRNIPIEAPASSAASSTYPGGIQRLETSDVKEQEESTESLQMQLEGAIQAKCSECEQQEKEEQNKESVQTKLTVGAPGDKYEQEADSMAAKVMTMPDSAIQQPIQRQTGEETQAVQMQPLVNSITPLVQRSSGKEEEVQMKSGAQRASDGSSQASGSVENQLAGSKGGGSALPDNVRSFMEPRFGADFSSVRVHTDSNAVQMNKELGAQAFAHGSDIYYGAGKSPGKDELTAHELTHTVQQGGAVRAKQQTPSEVASSKTDSSSNEQTQTAATTADTQTSAESSKVESAEEQSSDNPGKQAEALPNDRPTKENATKAGKPESAQGVEIVPQPGKSAVENGSEAKREGETSPAAKAVEATKAQEKIQLPKEATAPGKEEKTKGKQGQENAKQSGKGESKALEKVPQAQALKEGTAANEKANQTPEGNKEAANGETAAKKEKAVAEAQSATTELEATNAAVAQLAGAGINFAPPEQEEAGGGKETPVVALKADQPSGNSGLIEQQRAQASTMASSFLAEASGKVQTITGLGQSLPRRIMASAENAKATVMAALEQQKAAVTAQIAQLRSQAQSEGQAVLAQIQAQHQAAAAAIPQTTATARQQIDTEHNTALQTVDERVNSQITRIEELYNQANGKYRAAGNVVGSEAIAKGEARAKGYESQITGKDNSFWDGPLTDNKNKARANAAREVGKQYKQGLIDEANKQADQAQEGKSKDIEAVHQIAAKSRETLKTQHQATLDSLNSAEKQALSQVQEAQTSLTEAANKTLQATLQSLDQQQASQLQLVTNYGQQQVASIDGNAQKVIATLQQGINRAGTSLQKALQTFQAQAKGIAAPDPAALSETLAQARAQIDGAIAQVQGQLEGNLATSEQGIAQGGQQAIQNLSAIGQGGIQEAQAAGTSFTTTLTQLNQSATDTFNKLQETHQTTVKSTTETAVSGFKEVTKGIETTFNQANQNLEKGLENSVNQLQEGLRGALGQMDADINKYAEEAAAQEQPRWKKVLKILFIVAVIVVVAVVAGPAVIGAVGAMAGALGASAAVAGAVGAVVGGAIIGAASGAVIQMGSNLIDGKNIMEGVGQAALIGAIGGALGGAGGALGQGLGQAGKLGGGMSQSLGKFGIETAFDVTANILGDLASGQPLTLEGIMEGAAQGVAMSLGMNKFSKIGRVNAAQTKFSNAGANFGNSFGGKINSGFGRGVDVPTGSVSDVDMPSVKQPEVKAPETAVKPPQTEVKTPETGVKSPETGVKLPETEVKAPETNVKPPETEVKTPETQMKPPETTVLNGRSTHFDEPEVEPGVVAKEQTSDGHNIKVLKDGRLVRCSTCEDIRGRYEDILNQKPYLKEELDNIETNSNPTAKANKAREFEQKLEKFWGKQKASDDLEGEPSSKRSKDESESPEQDSQKRKLQDPEEDEIEQSSNTQLGNERRKRTFRHDDSSENFKEPPAFKSDEYSASDTEYKSSDNEQGTARNGKTKTRKRKRGIYNFTKKSQSSKDKSKVDNKVRGDKEGLEAAKSKLNDDAKAIHDVIPKTIIPKSGKNANNEINNESFGATTITTAILRDTKTEAFKKFVFTNLKGPPPPNIRAEAEKLGYHVVTSKEASHAEGQQIRFVDARGTRYELVSQGADKRHCFDCDWAMTEYYGSDYPTQQNKSDKKFKNWHQPQRLKNALGKENPHRQEQPTNKKRKIENEASPKDSKPPETEVKPSETEAKVKAPGMTGETSTTRQSKMATGAATGKDPTPDTIREGSVRMEQHPQYQETIRQVTEAGFEIKVSDGARVAVKEVMDSDGNVIRVEKTLYVQENMRYLDLEHELGHIKQLERFGDNIPPTQRVTEQQDGSLKTAPNQQEILTTWQNTITEYHNRLDEFIRLHERGASPELLKEHADGVEEWYQAYWKKGLRKGNSTSQKQWADKYFPDIAELRSRYLEIVKTIK